MNAMGEAWSDERLDDLNHRVDEGFNRCEREFQALRLEMRTEFSAVRSEMKGEFAAVRLEIKTDIGSLRSEMAAFQRMFLQVAGGMTATILVGFAGLIATQL